MKTRHHYSVLAFLLCVQVVVHAQPGALDDTFGTEGIVLLSATPGNDFLSAAAVQSTGHVVLLSGSRLFRLDEDGALDAAFGTAGEVEVGGLFADQLHILSDDGILVAGTTDDGDFSLRRYMADGILDVDFGTAGTTVADLGYNEALRGLLVISNGDLIAVGQNFVSGNNDALVARFSSDGILDTSFGNNGVLVLDVAGSNDVAWDAAELSNGDLVIAIQGFETVNKYSVARITEAGSLVTSFGTNGFFKLAVDDRPSNLRKVAVDSSGKIVCAGFYDNVMNFDWASFRLNPNGTLDNSFGTDGVRREPTTTEANDMVLTANDGFIVAGWGPGLLDDFLMVRYLSDGTPDPSFGLGADGFVRTDSGSEQHNRAVALVPLPDGKLLLAGHAQIGGNWQLMLARYNMDIGTSLTLAEGSDLVCWPNPATGILHITGVVRTDRVVLLDTRGRTVLELSPYAERFTLDLSTLPTGLYQLRSWNANGNQFVRKVVRE